VPERDLHEPWIEAVFGRLLAALRPDVLHVQELLGLPSAILEQARAAGVPVVMTLQDYFPVCPSVRLLDAAGERCLRREVTPLCAAACAGAPADPAPVIARTLRYELTRAREAVPGLRDVTFGGLRPLVDPLVGRASGAPAPPPDPPPLAAVQHRRDVNVARLNAVDVLLAQSHRVEALYRAVGVESARLRTLHLTLAHLERLTPRPPRRPGPLTFSTVDGLSAPAKGSRLLLDAVRIVRERGGAGRFRLLAHGFVDPAVAAEAAALPEVELRGLFRPEDVDGLLDEADVGVIPSVWEEAYGFVGLEFLAKGIPLLASARGGIVDYAREGETAWLNRSVTPEELAAQMGRLIEHPREVDALAARVRERRDGLIVPLARHADELEAAYREAGATSAS
jgi:glycosyltransferase involved in cell wall biosynthesis